MRDEWTYEERWRGEGRMEGRGWDEDEKVIVRLGVEPAPTFHMLKTGVSERSQLDGSHTPFKIWSD